MMNFLYELKTFWKEVLIILLELIIITILLSNKTPIKESIEESIVSDEVTIEKEKTTYKIDIKGAVVNPGVYELEKTAIINDVIEKAGGLKKNANTSNINLSKQIENEMVIKIFTTNEINKLKQNETIKKDPCIVNSEIISKCEDESIIIPSKSETNNTSEKDNNSNNISETIKDNIENNKENDETAKLININTAAKEELMTLNGVGESKANAIIEYRNNTPFTKIEDIKNVSGIGEQAFEKIKDYITI